MIKVFDYICSDCGNEFERFVKKTDLSVECPECGSTKTVQTMPNSSFKVKGQGQYSSQMKV